MTLALMLVGLAIIFLLVLSTVVSRLLYICQQISG